MTRRIAVASLIVVTLVVGLVGVVTYGRFAQELRQQDDAPLAAHAARPLSLLLRPTSSELAQLRSANGPAVFPTPALAALGALPPLRPGYATVETSGLSLRVYMSTLPGGRSLVVAQDRIAVAGAANLSRFGPDFDSQIRPMLQALEEQVVLLHLLGEAENTSTMTVRIGTENSRIELTTASVVATPYGNGTDHLATMGVLGPTRMDYPGTIAAVGAVARYVTRILSGD